MSILLPVADIFHATLYNYMTLEKDHKLLKLLIQWTPPFCAPEATAGMTGIVYGSVQAPKILSNLESQDCL